MQQVSDEESQDCKNHTCLIPDNKQELMDEFLMTLAWHEHKRLMKWYEQAPLFHLIESLEKDYRH